MQSKSRRKSFRVPTVGLDASTKTRRGSVAAHVRSAKGTLQLKLAQSSMRSMQVIVVVCLRASLRCVKPNSVMVRGRIQNVHATNYQSPHRRYKRVYTI